LRRARFSRRCLRNFATINIPAARELPGTAANVARELLDRPRPGDGARPAVASNKFLAGRYLPIAFLIAPTMAGRTAPPAPPPARKGEDAPP